MSKRTVYRCDRCKKDYEIRADETNLLRFNHFEIRHGSAFNELQKMDLCHACQVAFLKFMDVVE